MARIVKDLNEAKEKGYLNPQPQNGGMGDLGKIISDIKDIVQGVGVLKSLNVQKQDMQNQAPTQQQEYKKMDFKALPKTESGKSPVAVLKIDEERIDKLLNEDLNNLLSNPNINQEMTLKELIENFGHLKGLLKPEIKKFVAECCKATMEWK